jgi:hypothetical protein
VLRAKIIQQQKGVRHASFGENRRVKDSPIIQFSLPTDYDESQDILQLIQSLGLLEVVLTIMQHCSELLALLRCFE